MSKEKEIDGLEDTKRIMGSLVRMPPKPHDEMKLGKSRKKRKKKYAVKKHR